MVVPNRSRQVCSSQKTIHARLDKLLASHLSSEWRQPLHPPSVGAFEALKPLLANQSGRLVLDSGCGTGESTRLLARAMPDCIVMGVDKSSSRLGKTGAKSLPHRENNAIFIRADLRTFWRLALGAGWRLHRHYLLYPNPWPKPGDLQKRWHAHPVFPTLLQLGGRLEMRCNWDIYALEFALAVNRVRGLRAEPGVPDDLAPISPFELKYRDSGHSIYSVSCDLSGVN